MAIFLWSLFSTFKFINIKKLINKRKNALKIHIFDNVLSPSAIL